MARDRSIKRLQSRLKEIDREKEVIRLTESSISKQQSALDKEANMIKSKLEAASNVDWPRVTEHALLRYIQRVKGIDIDEVEKEILPRDDDRLNNAFDTLGTNGTFPVGTSHSVVIENGKVVTVKT